MDDEDSDDDDGMVLDDELIRDYMLNTELADLNLDVRRPSLNHLRDVWVGGS